MKIILLSTVVALALAVAAATVLDTRFQKSSEAAFTTAGARIGGPAEISVE